MHRDDLIECLARELHAARYPEVWENSTPERWNWCRSDAATMLPGVVAFVGEWIGEHCGDATHDGLVYAQEWREAMGRDAK